MTVQSNVDGGATSGPNPRGNEGLAVLPGGFGFGNPTDVVISNTFADSTDYLFAAADQVTAAGFNTHSFFGSPTVQVRVFDMAGNLLGTQSPDDAWATGTFKIAHPEDQVIGFQTFTIHWDGNSWNYVESPITPRGMTGASLQSVVAYGSDNVFAVGHIVDPVPGNVIDTNAYALHWDGADWSPLPAPPILGRYNQFDDVAIVDGDTLMAVGGHSGNTYGARDQPYVATWSISGNSWTVVDVPVPPGQNFLESITVNAPDDIWIAGTNDPFDAPFRPLFLHFDGSDWTIHQAVDFAYYGGTVRGITAVAPDELYASGSFTVQERGFSRQMLMKYDGTGWRQVDTDPDGPDGGTLFAIDSVGDGEVWAVGIQSGTRTVTQRLTTSQGSPAMMFDSKISSGNLVKGTIEDLEQSDDSWLVLSSGYGFSFLDLHNMELQLSAMTTAGSPEFIDLTIESSIDYSTGFGILYLRNHKTGAWDQVGTYSLTDADAPVSIAGINAANYVGPAGEIDLSIKHRVIVPQLIFEFDSFLDHVEILVR